MPNTRPVLARTLAYASPNATPTESGATGTDRVAVVVETIATGALAELFADGSGTASLNRNGQLLAGIEAPPEGGEGLDDVSLTLVDPTTGSTFYTTAEVVCGLLRRDQEAGAALG